MGAPENHPAPGAVKRSKQGDQAGWYIGTDAVGEDEPTLGSIGDVSQEQWAAGDMALDEYEDENEHGGDINDEPHDDKDEGNHEPNLGRLETIHQGSGSYSGQSDDSPQTSVDFKGDGYHAARQVLRNLKVKRPDKPQEHVRVSCAYGDPNALTVDGLKIAGRPEVDPPTGDPDQLTIIRPGVARLGGIPELKASDFGKLPWA